MLLLRAGCYSWDCVVLACLYISKKKVNVLNKNRCIFNIIQESILNGFHILLLCYKIETSHASGGLESVIGKGKVVGIDDQFS